MRNTSTVSYTIHADDEALARLHRWMNDGEGYVDTDVNMDADTGTDADMDAGMDDADGTVMRRLHDGDRITPDELFFIQLFNESEDGAGSIVVTRRERARRHVVRRHGQPRTTGETNR